MHRRGTILVVDDERDIRESLHDALTDEGYDVLMAANGREALSMMDRLSWPCAVILDLIMPVMSGSEFYAALRAVPTWADIPVLISTSDSSRAPLDVPVLRKPVNLERLSAMVAALFPVVNST